MLDISAPLKIAFNCDFLVGFYEKSKDDVNTQFARKEGYP